MTHPEPIEPATAPGVVSVAALTDTGPREANEDRMFTSVSDDGSWVIAVADGLGGHARGDEAAQAAVDGLPERIGGAADMAMAFTDADERVRALSRSSPLRARYVGIPIARIPMSTLCVAAWTPEGGLLVGWMGDTMTFVLRSGQDGYTGSCCGPPHRSPFGGIEICLGLPPEDEGYDTGPTEVGITDGFEDFGLPDAVIIASDGAWEPLAIEYGGAEWLWDDTPAGIGSACDPAADDASGIARSVLAKARSLGLNDNATIAVAHWRRPPGR